MTAATRPGVTPATQEIRFATAMTGGVSLAIWMGGVARELNLLDQASRRRESSSADDDSLSPEDRRVRDLYGDLLDLLDAVVRIDVLAGTSAGGINAALLGLCHATGWDLGWLRDVWLTAGDLDRLLRDPAARNPPSLLRGDGVLLEQLDRNISRPNASVSELARATTVHITTTLLDGETSRFTDSYGTLVPDVNHLGLFRFTEQDLRTEDGRHALALAGRASASFPAAFEPAFLPYRDAVTTRGDGPAVRPAMEPYLSVTRPHWAADGGILANRPIAPILDSIFQQPAHGHQVRRVLLYIVPDPGGVPKPDAEPVPLPSIDKPLHLAGALVRDVGAAFNQSIAAELSAIQTHNERVDARRDSRLRLAELGTQAANGAAIVFPTAGAWSDYVARQGEWLVRPVVRALMRTVSTMPTSAIPARWIDELSLGHAVETACCKAAATAVTSSWQQPGPDSTAGELAELGRPAFDGVKAVVISLIQLGYASNPAPADRMTLAGLGTRIHAAFQPATVDAVQSDVASETELAASQPTPPALTELAKRLALAHASAQNAARADGLPIAWTSLDDVLADLAPVLEAIVAEPAGTRTPTADLAIVKLRTYLDFLGADRAQWRSRLVGLHVMDRSMQPVGADVEQKVELVQVSATTRSLLDPERDDPSSKLTGTQFHHFGAFYKGSWRANDWMWGRLDGAGWLVHVLLDPRRILAVVDAEPDFGAAAGSRGEAFFRRLDELAGSSSQRYAAEAAAARTELGFLDRNDELPLSLPATALWLAAAWQRPIVEAELPVVAREALAAPTKRDQSWATRVLDVAGQGAQAEAASRLAVARVASGRAARLLREKPPEWASTSTGADEAALVNLLPGCPVPAETLGAERGEPLFTRTVAKSAAVATAAATAVERPPATISTVFSTARTTTLTGYRAANTVGFWPRRIIAAGVALVAAGVVLGAQGSTALGLTGLALTLAGLYVFAFGVWSLSPRILGVLVTATLLCAVFALTLPTTRRLLFGTDDGEEQGWVIDTLIPWMRDRWWALLAILAVVIVVPALASYLVKGRGDRHRAARRG